ncbi:MAG: Ig-like domain-containing protein [bacterium]
MPYYYKPQKTKRTAANKKLYKKLFKSLGLSFGIILFMYFWLVTVIPNINIVWDIFKHDAPQNSETALVPPKKPILLDTPKFTNKERFDIKGTAKSGTNVKLYMNEREIQETLADNDESFTFNEIPIQKDNTEIYVTSVDSRGNVSEPSTTHKIVYDNKPPEIIITKPSGQNVEEPVNAYTIEGKINENAKVTVNGRTAQTLYDGIFEITINLNEGGNSFKIEVVDQAGNKTTKDIYINFSKTE